MKARPEAQDTKTVIRLIDEHYEEDLQKTIVDCKAYKDHQGKLPSVETIVYLYVKECLRFVVGNAKDGVLYIQERDIDSYIQRLFNRAVLDGQTLLLFLKGFNRHMAILENKGRIDADVKAVIRSILEQVKDNYWESRINGVYDIAMDIIQYTSAYLLSASGDKAMEEFQRGLNALLEDYNMSRASAKAPNKTIRVDNLKDLTIIIDYSFDRDKDEASFRLTSGSQSLRLTKLLQPGLLEFLIENIVNPLTRKFNYVKPGQIAIIDPQKWEEYGKKRTHHIDHINKEIKKHIESDKKLQFFSQKGRSIEVKVHIRIETMPREELFKH